jgi:predicted glycosyltransferase
VNGSVLFYVQHLLGIGHLRRALRIADALGREGVRVTLVSGGEPISMLTAASADRVVQLPPIRARNADFKELIDTKGQPVDEALQSARKAALLSGFAAAQPDAVLIEAFPFGRRAFRSELDALISAAQSRRPRALVLCSLRDIVVVHPTIRRHREIVDRVRADFDFVLLHGDPAFIPLEASFPLASEIADRLIYTGYVSESEEQSAKDEIGVADGKARTDEVVVSVGGGAIGALLLSTALESRRRGCLPGSRWHLLTGPNLPEAEFRALAGALPQGVVIERYRPDFPQMLRRCRVSVSQAGYNTTMDILTARAAAVVVPFAAALETEQTLRAERLAALGVLEMVRERELSPDRLCQAMHRAIARRPREVAIATGGAQRSAKAVVKLIQSRKHSTDTRLRVCELGI